MFHLGPFSPASARCPTKLAASPFRILACVYPLPTPHPRCYHRRRRVWGRAVGWTFLVRLFHSLFQSGLTRRFPRPLYSSFVAIVVPTCFVPYVTCHESTVYWPYLDPVFGNQNMPSLPKNGNGHWNFPVSGPLPMVSSNPIWLELTPAPPRRASSSLPISNPSGPMKVCIGILIPA